ncbi:Spore germination protein [uncultured Clostridium sp.]|nr:Spore germination protein [uncultured Clostridium sp.]
MLKKSKVYITVLLFVLCMLCGCAKRTEVKNDDSFIYSVNGERNGLVKINYDFRGKTTEEQVNNVIKELQKPAEEINYSTTIPKQIKIQQCEIRHMIVYIDLNDAYLKLPVVEQKLILASMTQSIVKIPKISAIYVTVDGEELKDDEGNPAGIINEDDFVQNNGSSLSSYEETELALYFANESGDKLVKQNVQVKYSTNTSKEKLIVEKLMHGPQGESVHPIISSTCTLLSVTVKDNICYVNFDSEFLASAHDIKPEITIYSIVNSLIEGTAVNKVQIMVNGEKNVLYMNTIDLSHPLQQDLDLIQHAEE